MVEVDDVQVLAHLDVGNLTILQIDHLVGIFHDGGSVAGDVEVLVVLAHTHHQRTGLASCHQVARVFLLDDSDGIGTDGIVEGLAYGRHQVLAVLLVVIVYQLGEHLGVRVALELIALVVELFFEHLVVLDDAIVNQGDVSTHADMRVRIGCGRLAVGSPTGMGDADMTCTVLVGSHSFQIAHLALCLVDIELVVIIDQRHAGAVVPAVFQLLQSLDEDGEGI